MKSGKWDVRIERARELVSTYPSAAEGLRFYGHIAQFQRSLYGELENQCGTAQVARAPGTLKQEFDPFVLLPRFGPFLAIVKENAPEPLARGAAELRATGVNLWQEILTGYWQTGADSTSATPDDREASQMFLAWTFLQPYAEYLADYTARPPLHSTPSVCPLCSSKPLVGVLRTEGDGGKRFLICSLCATEWDFRRLVCAACGEEDVHKLAVYSAKEIGHVRVEACDTCHQYIKTVDLTKDGHAVPLVDELATIPLNLWAAEHGYAKIQSNLLGI
ncbi:MAG: formate dehydrogenase accessory protein FdhE [Candidatus Acidiferrales bacterium]